jgi:hypothetical protein
MSFVPGSIAGEILLGIDGFTQPLLQAEHLAQAFPELMAQSLAQPLRELGDLAEQIGGELVEPFAEISSSAADSARAVADSTGQMGNDMGRFVAGAHEAGEAAEETGESITHGMLTSEAIMSLFSAWVADFVANPLLGVIGLAKETGSALAEAFSSIADEALDISLASEKLGVSAQFFSKWSGVAKAVKVDADELSNGMYMLNRIVGEEMLNPTKELTQAFQALGITQQWLNSHAGDTEAIFQKIKDGLDAMTDSQERSAVAQAVAGRGAKDLIPLFLMQRNEVNELMEAQRQFGDVTDESEAKAGRAFKKLKVEFGEMVEGLEKKASLYILDYIESHGPQIEHVLHSISDEGQKELTKLANWAGTIKWEADFKLVLADLNLIVSDIPKIGTEIVKMVEVVAAPLEQLATWAKDAFEWMNKIVGITTPSQHQTYDKFGNATKGTGSGTKGESGMDAIADMVFDDPHGQYGADSSLRPHLDPAARQRAEQYVAKELHIHVPAGTNDAQLGAFLAKAIAKARADAAAQSSAATGGQH